MQEQRLSSLIDKLHALRADFMERLARIRRRLHHADGPVSANFMEQAVQRENDEVLLRLEAATQSDLKQIEHALHRADAGLFQLCETCGERIEMERLEALPFATQCRCCVARHDTEALLRSKAQRLA
jgi:DnaK suppressor protein